MKPVTSQRHLLNFYITLVVGCIIFIALVALPFILISKGGQQSGKGIFFLVPVTVFMAVYTVIQYFKNVPIVYVNQEKICFNKQTFFWSDIVDIRLTGKQPFKYIKDFPMEGIALRLNNGKTKYIFDQYYSNSWQLKSFIQQIIINKQTISVREKLSISKKELGEDLFEIFRGDPLTSMRGISFWLITLLLGGALLRNIDKPTAAVSISLLIVLSLIMHSWTMHYFEISDNFLVIRNHNYFWKRNAYRIEDIKEVVFDTYGKMPHCLRVITKDFRNKMYPAGTLRDKKWLELQAKLESRGIKVRNEFPLIV